ncbi:matrixin family metalloprotease, partial [candidate division KSB1 bacterium]
MKKRKLIQFFLFILSFIIINTNAFSERYMVIIGPGEQVSSEYMSRGWIGSDNICHWAGTTVYWYVNSNGAGDGLTFGQTQETILDAYDSWEDVTTAIISFSYSGSTSSTWAVDSKNVHYWAEDPEDPIFERASGFLGVTIITINSNEEYTDVDIVYNGKDVTWEVEGEAPCYDIQAVATHEIGHQIGLAHSDVEGATMLPQYNPYDPTAMSSLEDDDR